MENGSNHFRQDEQGRWNGFSQLVNDLKKEGWCRCPRAMQNANEKFEIS